VTVSLVGRSQAKIKEGSRLYSGTAILFQQSNTLNEGHLSPREYEWSFEFIFPTGTSGEGKKRLGLLSRLTKSPKVTNYLCP
jgi:hypothetical protein